MRPGKVPGEYYVGSVPRSQSSKAPVPQQPKGGGPATTQAEQVPTPKVDRPTAEQASQASDPVKNWESGRLSHARNYLSDVVRSSTELMKIKGRNPTIEEINAEIDKAESKSKPSSGINWADVRSYADHIFGDYGWDDPKAQSLPYPKSAEEIEALAKDSLYRATVGGKKMVAVRGEGKRGGGDRLFYSIEEANTHIERQKVIDQQSEESRKQREAKEAEEAKRNLNTLPRSKDLSKTILASLDVQEKYSTFSVTIVTSCRLASRS